MAKGTNSATRTRALLLRLGHLWKSADGLRSSHPGSEGKPPQRPLPVEWGTTAGHLLSQSCLAALVGPVRSLQVCREAWSAS